MCRYPSSPQSLNVGCHRTLVRSIRAALTGSESLKASHDIDCPAGLHCPSQCDGPRYILGMQSRRRRSHHTICHLHNRHSMWGRLDCHKEASPLKRKSFRKRGIFDCDSRNKFQAGGPRRLHMHARREMQSGASAEETPINPLTHLQSTGSNHLKHANPTEMVGY